MDTKQTLSERIYSFLGGHPEGATSGQIHKNVAPKQKLGSVYTTLWHMRKKGEVRHDSETSKYCLMTSCAEAESAKAQPKETNAHTVPWPQYHILRDERDELRDKYDRLEAHHAEALAVMRYLETKVEILIRKQVI